MTPFLVLLFALSVTCDTAGQLCFKIAGQESGHSDSLLSHLRHTLGKTTLWAGLLIYAVQVVVWLMILERAPLSVAFPVASLSYCSVTVVSSVVLGEKVKARRWIGITLITAGVIVVGIGA